MATPTTIAHLRWQPYQLPLRQPFANSRGPLIVRYGAIVTLTLADGTHGNGDIAPLPYHDAASLTAALARVPELAAALTDQPTPVALESIATYAQSSAFPAALLCGVETALLDAIGKREGRSLATLLADEQAAIRASVPVNAVIGGGNLADGVRAACEAVAAGFTCLKLKAGALRSTAREIERIAAIREAIGPVIALRLDANASWTFDEAIAILTACAPIDIQYVEQPLPVGRLAEMSALRWRVPVPIAADEELTGLASARRVLDAGAADVLVIKPQTAGGLLASKQIIRAATASNVCCVLTSAIESGIGVAATLHLAAAMPEVSLACGLATLPLLHDDLIIEELPLRNGMMAVPNDIGLGVTLDEAALTRYSHEYTE
jgi:o-succinylbenzoate synthase